mmetsp:Transcript_56250/g.134040  ORF Transcript_56250/g.134040 Transcript_56250/m.134040 type:complete len:211 (-) Transcript_56250:643-1275(-)
MAQLLNFGYQTKGNDLIWLLHAELLGSQLQAFQRGSRLLLGHHVRILEEGYPDRVSVLILLQRKELQLAKGDEKLPDSIFRHKGRNVDQAQAVIDGRDLASGARRARERQLTWFEGSGLCHHIRKPGSSSAGQSRQACARSWIVVSSVALWPANLQLTAEELDTVESETVGCFLCSAKLDKGKQASASHGGSQDWLTGQGVHLDCLCDLI